MARTVPPNIWEWGTNGLVQMATTSPIHPQRMAKCDNRKIPIRVNHGTCTLCAHGKNPLPSAHSRLQACPDQSHEVNGTAGNNEHPTDNNQGN